MSAQKTMFCLIVCPGGAVQAPGKPLLSAQQDSTFLKYLSLTASSILIAFGNSGDNAALALEDLRRLNQEIQTDSFAIRTKKSLCSMLRAYIQFYAIY